MMIPRSQTANNLLAFFKSHRTQAELLDREQLHKQLGFWVEEDNGGKENPFATDYDERENEIVFETTPTVSERCIDFANLTDYR
jgi:hypothetical protein